MTSLHVVATPSSSSAHHNQISSSSDTVSMERANEFKRELDALLFSRPPISKEKMSLLVDKAMRAARTYKHVVYFVETFIKNVMQTQSNSYRSSYLNL